MRRSRETVSEQHLQLCTALWAVSDSDSPVFCSAAVGLEVEMENMTNKSSSDSRDPLTPDLQEPAPQKKKKKKKASNIGNKAFTSFYIQCGTIWLVGDQEM